MNLNESSFEDLLSEGVPVHVSARCMEERKAGAYKDWGDFHARLFYCQGSSGVKPAEGLLLRHIKGCFIPSSSSDSEATKTDSVGSGLKDSNVAQMSAGGVMSRGPWWDWPEQKEDDTFPAEFRSRPFSEAEGASVGCGKDASPELHLKYTFLYSQIEQVRAGTMPTFEFCGFDLSKDEKDKLTARWAKEYPELPEAVVVARDVVSGQGAGVKSPPPDTSLTGGQSNKGSSDTAGETGPAPAVGSAAFLSASELASRLQGFRVPVWSQLRRLDGVVPARVVEVPEDLQDGYRVDPFGNIVAEGAEPLSICHFEVEHLFPRRRGGRTVLQNLAAVQWFSSRVRGGRMLSSVIIRTDGSNPLSCGLNDSMLQDLWAARSRLPVSLQSTSAFRSILSALLMTNWHRGDGKDLFNTKTGLLHTTAPEHLFDALLKAFHASTSPLVAGWHLGLLVGMPDDPTAESASTTPSKGGWPLTPSRAAVVYQTFNQVIRLAQEIKMDQISGLPHVFTGTDDIPPPEEFHPPISPTSPSTTSVTDVTEKEPRESKKLMLSSGKQRRRMAEGQLQKAGEKDSSDVTPDQLQQPSLVQTSDPTIILAPIPPSAPITPSADPAPSQKSTDISIQRPLKGNEVQTPLLEGPHAAMPSAIDYQNAPHAPSHPYRSASGIGHPLVFTPPQPPPPPATAEVLHSHPSYDTMQPMAPLPIPPAFPAMPRHHPTMTGRPLPPPTLPPPTENPLPQGMTFDQLQEDFILPAWARGSTMYRAPNAPLTPGSNSEFWSPEFEPWRHWRAAGALVPAPDNGTGNSLESRAVRRYTQELNAGQGSHSNSPNEGSARAPLSYVSANSAMLSYNGSGTMLHHSGTDLVDAQYASYELHRGRPPAVPAGGFQGQQQFGNVGQAVQAGTWPGMAVQPLPSWQPFISALVVAQGGPTGGEPSGSFDPFYQPQGGLINDDPRQREADMARFRLQNAIALAQRHHPLMSGVRATGGMQQQQMGAEVFGGDPADPVASAIRNKVDSDIYQAFPDPMGNFEQFVRYDEWLRHYRQQLSNWERRVEWEKDWHRRRADVLMHHQAFAFATQQQLGMVPDSGPQDPSFQAPAEAAGATMTEAILQPSNPGQGGTAQGAPLDFASWLKLQQNGTLDPSHGGNAQQLQQQPSAPEASPIQPLQQEQEDQETLQQEQWKAWLPWMQWYQQQWLQAQAQAATTTTTNTAAAMTEAASTSSPVELLSSPAEAVQEIMTVGGDEGYASKAGARRSSLEEDDQLIKAGEAASVPMRLSTPSSSLRRTSDPEGVFAPPDTYPDGYTVLDEGKPGSGGMAESAGSGAAKLFAAVGRLFGKIGGRGGSDGGGGTRQGGDGDVGSRQALQVQAGSLPLSEPSSAAVGGASLSPAPPSSHHDGPDVGGAPVSADVPSSAGTTTGAKKASKSKWAKVMEALTGGSETEEPSSQRDNEPAAGGTSIWRSPGQWFGGSSGLDQVAPAHRTTDVFAADSMSPRHFQDMAGGSGGGFGPVHLEPVIEGEEDDEDEGTTTQPRAPPAASPSAAPRQRVSGSGFYPEVPTHLVGDAAYGSVPPQGGTRQQPQPKVGYRDAPSHSSNQSGDVATGGTRPRTKQRMRS